MILKETVSGIFSHSLANFHNADDRTEEFRIFIKPWIEWC